jgi:hypothetical protein
MRTVFAILLMPTLACTQTIADLPDIVSDGFKLRSVRIIAAREGIPNTLIVSIESPASWDWTKGLRMEFGIAGSEDGEALCGIYEAVLTKRPGNTVRIPIRLLNPGGRCRPDEIHVYSLETAEDRIKAVQTAELTKKKAANAAETLRAHLAQSPTLSSGFEEVFVGSDRKCAQQFMEALSIEGLEKRKRIADLVSYGCGFTVPAGTHVKLSQNSGQFVQVSVVEGRYSGKFGWVPSAWMKY